VACYWRATCRRLCGTTRSIDFLTIKARASFRNRWLMLRTENRRRCEVRSYEQRPSNRRSAPFFAQ
jgi:hypothetical protein